MPLRQRWKRLVCRWFDHDPWPKMPGTTPAYLVCLRCGEDGREVKPLPLKRLREWIAYRWVPKCEKCHRPLDRAGTTAHEQRVAVVPLSVGSRFWIVFRILDRLFRIGDHLRSRR